MEKQTQFFGGIIISFLFLGSIIYADSNGVWHDAKDVKSGSFGSDESSYGDSSDYVFNNPVRFIKNSQFDNNVVINGSLELNTIKAKSGSNGNVIIQLG